MSNPIFDAIGGNPAQNNIMQRIQEFGKTINGNPEQIVRNLLASGRMSQQQFNTFSQMARQFMKK